MRWLTYVGWAAVSGKALLLAGYLLSRRRKRKGRSLHGGEGAAGWTYPT